MHTHTDHQKGKMVRLDLIQEKEGHQAIKKNEMKKKNLVSLSTYINNDHLETIDNCVFVEVTKKD